MTKSQNIQTATFGAGCFWGVEAIFAKLDGVLDAVSGYSGGQMDNPTYEQVCEGTTGHAEVVEISYDADVISYETLLDYFWRMHDPTTPNQQGPNFGTQYRSVIYYHNDQQKDLAEKSKQALQAKGIFKNEIITEITAVETFYKAEEYHQDYYDKKYQGKPGPICHILRDT
jgi:peptide-methionine (S)-S-oxide reductase